MQFRPEPEFIGTRNKNPDGIPAETGIFWKLGIFYESRTKVKGEGGQWRS